MNEAADPWAGLLGPIIITTPDNAKDDGSPKDVDRWVLQSNQKDGGCLSLRVGLSS